MAKLALEFLLALACFLVGLGWLAFLSLAYGG